MTVSRPKKFEHIDTIQYEVDMLVYCYRRLLERNFADNPSYFLCIEGFLIHYRNLCEFFGNKKELRAGEPEGWTDKKLNEEEKSSIQNTQLDEHHNSSISRYISHCTKIRADRDRDWDPETLFEEMKPCIDSFRKLFPRELIPPTAEAHEFKNVSTSSLSYGVLTGDNSTTTKKF